MVVKRLTVLITVATKSTCADVLARLRKEVEPEASYTRVIGARLTQETSSLG